MWFKMNKQYDCNWTKVAIAVLLLWLGAVPYTFRDAMVFLSSEARHQGFLLIDVFVPDMQQCLFQYCIKRLAPSHVIFSQYFATMHCSLQSNAPFRCKAIQVRPVWTRLCAAVHVKNSQTQTYRGATVHVRRVWCFILLGQPAVRPQE